MEKPTGSPASGAKEKVEKQARQLAYDTRYKVRQALNKGTKMSPAEVSKAYVAQLAKSPAPPAVKARAKQMLLGEDLVDTKKLATDTIVSALYKVFVEGVTVEEVEVEVQEEVKEKQYKIRVTDKKTGNTYVRMASRAKIAELRANPNISSVEMTQYGEPTKSERHKGSSTAKAKSGKGLDPVGQEDDDVNNDGKVNKTDKYLKHRRDVRGAAISTRKEDYNWKDGFAELIEKKKESETEKKITGEGVNNSKLITVFPDENSGIKEGMGQEQPAQAKQLQQASAQKTVDAKSEQRRKQAILNQKKILMAKLQQLQKGIPLSQEEVEMEGDQIDEKITAKTDMGAAIKDFYASKSPQLAGRTKEERRKAAIAAVLTARRGGRKLGEEMEGCECGKTPCECDEREMPTKASLLKNKMRARGIQVAGETPSPRNMKTYDDLGEAAEDRARDEHQMRGGMAARVDYDRPPAKKLSNKELGIRDFTPAEKEKRAKEMAAHLKKMRNR
jgi:hypothetical protein